MDVCMRRDRTCLRVMPMLLGLTLLGLLGGFSSSARAEGSATIAEAPAATPGKLIGSNLAIGPDEQQGDYNYCKWWTVSLGAHDQAQISGSQTFGTTVYPPGTNDSDYTATQSLANGYLTQGVSWTAQTSGVYPISICGSAYGFVIGQESVGPFTFQVNAYHSAILYAVKQISTGIAGKLTVYVRDVAGKKITSAGLAVHLYGNWKDAAPVPATSHLLASAHPINGIASLRFKLPRSFARKSVHLTITGSGAEFQKMKTLSCIDRVR